MKNKVLVKIYVPNIDEEYELYIPINESVKKVLELIVKCVYEFSDSTFNYKDQHCLLDPDTAIIYASDQIIRDTNIKNSKKIILI